MSNETNKGSGKLTAIEKLWDDHSRGVPEDGYDAETELQWLMGESVMLKKDFTAAMEEYAAQQATAGEAITEKQIEDEAFRLYPDSDPWSALPANLRTAFENGVQWLQSQQPKKSGVDLAKIEKAFDDLLESETPESLREWLDKQPKAPDMDGFELAKELYDIAALQLMENVSGNSREALKEIIEKFESQSVAVKAIEPKAPSADMGWTKTSALNDFEHFWEHYSDLWDQYFSLKLREKAPSAGVSKEQAEEIFLSGFEYGWDGETAPNSEKLWQGRDKTLNKYFPPSEEQPTKK